MKVKKQQIGLFPVEFKNGQVEGELLHFNGEEMYCIRNFDCMPPFLMNIVSSSDLWMYLSSSGGLTAGRQNYNNALFPYETDDKLHVAAANTGPVTIIRILEEGNAILWEPFSDNYKGLYTIERNLYKNETGNKILFEENNLDLKLTFRYCWMNSDHLGWVRRAELLNNSVETRHVELLDGLLNILPWGIGRETQSMMSTLMDAYKVSELLAKHSMALYYLSSVPIDRAEPNEALRTNLVWTFGLEPKNILLSARQIQNFKEGAILEAEPRIFGQKTAFLLESSFSLAANEKKAWYLIADVAKDHTEIVAIQNNIEKQSNLIDYIEKSVEHCSHRLSRLVAAADGVQHTGDALNDRRHFANVLFNLLRGGIFEQGYQIEKTDFLEHIKERNPVVYEKHRHLIVNMEDSLCLDSLLKICDVDDDLLRMAYEYLPLGFSRRHGDPSRPWNFFDIKVKKADGTLSFNYQGNWRDIFQNWEALGFSFPAFIPGMVLRFLNASTADGYNPYRLTRQGFDWEVPEPENPWAYIGYWGDHQIIYLLSLMELQEKFFPGSLMKYANRNLFVYAQVPYRIKKYQEILQNPKDTIVFDWEMHNYLIKNAQTHGNDFKLVHYQNGQLQRGGFIEKILVALLTKLSNFVPDAGIWLNTQRPEWNDANNALVGNGASVVTLCHIHRFVKFLEEILKNSQETSFSLGLEVSNFFKNISGVFSKFRPELRGGFTPSSRKAITDALGLAGEHYRESVYKGFGGQFQTLSKDELLAFLGNLQEVTNHYVLESRRKDGLYHSYNLLEFKENGIEVNHLGLMVEGQVAILKSGILNQEQTKALLQVLFESNLWRPDQKSFMLYPWRDLPGFMEKNRIDPQLIDKSLWLKTQIKDGKTGIVKQDELGNLYFNSDLQNTRILQERLQEYALKSEGQLTKEEISIIAGIYEQVFSHRYFTGRSGSFYKYEGLGSIYWHMISKLLLTVGECITNFESQVTLSSDLSSLYAYYQQIREGIGVHKKPQAYGAFPTDPYSHTPVMMGAQQPGLTGQVKEDILSRFYELGIRVENGMIGIKKSMLTNNLFDEAGKCAFTLFNTSFVLENAKPTNARIVYASGDVLDVKCQPLFLPVDISSELFHRKNTISKVVFY
ncbi:MAG TPA: hypothetical protein VLH37_05775 [Bacteroidales bacterium]|nr:hypothetical protein [Bacteroidales bacterium]